MSAKALAADASHPATAGMRAMPQGVLGGGARTRDAMAKQAMTRAAEATLRGDPGAVELAAGALGMLERERDR